MLFLIGVGCLATGGCTDREHDPSAADTRFADGGEPLTDSRTFSDLINEASAPEPDLWQYPSSVRYLGYVVSGPHIDAVKDHTNMVHVSSDYAGGSDLEQLQQARQASLKVALDLVSVFFPRGCADFDLEKVSASQRWVSYAARIAPYADLIAAFYPADEPYWNCGPTNGVLSLAEVEAVLHAVNQQIKASFPQIPIAVVFGFPSVDASLIIPRGVDWVGFDCYDGFDACPDPNHPTASLGYPSRSVPEYLEILRQKKSPEQRLLLVPPAFLGYTGEDALSEQQIISIVDKYVALSLEDPEVVAIFAFLWPDLGVTPGARSLPGVVSRYREIAAQLIGKGSPPAPPLLTSSAPEVLFHGQGGAAAQTQFNIALEGLTGVIRGASAAQTYWCLSYENQGDCREIALGTTWNKVDTTDPAWLRDASTGEWRLALPQPALSLLPQGVYIVHVYDAQAQQRALPLGFRLARAPQAIASATAGGPAQPTFRRSTDNLFLRVIYPLRRGLYQCIEVGAEQRCASAPLSDSEAWAPISGDEDGWTYDETGKQWTIMMPQADLATLPNGSYTLHYLDYNSWLRSVITIQLVD